MWILRASTGSPPCFLLTVPEQQWEVPIWMQIHIRRTVLCPSDTLLATGFQMQADWLIQQGTDWDKFFILWFSLCAGKTNPKWVTYPPDHSSPSFSFSSFLFCLQANTCKIQLGSSWYWQAAAAWVFSLCKGSCLRQGKCPYLQNTCPHMLKRITVYTPHLSHTHVMCRFIRGLLCVKQTRTHVFPQGMGSHITVLTAALAQRHKRQFCFSNFTNRVPVECALPRNHMKLFLVPVAYEGVCRMLWKIFAPFLNSSIFYICDTEMFQVINFNIRQR